MKKDFAKYNVAIVLKELGFNEECFGEYRQWDGSEPYLEIYQDNNSECTNPFTAECLAPIYQQVLNWLREKHDINIYIAEEWKWGSKIGYNYVIQENDGMTESDTYKNYYEALDEVINEAIQIVQKKL